MGIEVRKFDELKRIIAEMGSVLVAYSGGVDSTLLLKVAADTLPNRVVAAIAVSPTYPEKEHAEARDRAERIGVRHITVESGELDIPQFAENPPDRCYYCKGDLYSRLKVIAESEGLEHIADGSNKDDEDDYRPGMRAAAEKGIRSPLREAGLTKADIRQLSRALGLPDWNKPSMACLASRFPYGDRITVEGLRMVADAEDCLRRLGMDGMRVRKHKGLARIEVSPGDLVRFADDGFRAGVVESFKKLGFTYVTLDLQGYRSGSMNEALGDGEGP
ncbi:ATP-dependent sacrificial sulfur transferase LarE [Chloroflexota bacterium]